VHRVLEWVAPALDRGAAEPGRALPPQPDLDVLALAAAQEFDADAAQVARLARTILDSGQCAPYFRGPGLRWAANEVPVGIDGVARRIDRLVCLDDAQGPVWWVLDYKLQHTPQALQSYREQLLGYRDAVRRAQPQQRVRCAFVTGAGAVVELDTEAPDRGPGGGRAADPAI
jgi:ATP-dependent helicase/nuclease subunit A